MGRLSLICHAATEATRQVRFPADEDLDARGLERLALLPAVQADRWLSAPETRSRHTTGMLCHKTLVSNDMGLRDWNCGRWAGRSVASIQAADPEAFAAWLSDADAAPHGGESLSDLLARVAEWLAGEAVQGGRTAAVAHPAILRAALAAVVGSGAPGFWRIDVQPLTRLQLSHDGRRWVLQGLIPPP